MCYIDFCNLNKTCSQDEFPFPNIDTLVDATDSHSMFSFINGFSGCNQIKIDPYDAEKTIFCTPMGNFPYTVLSLGLKNAGATYQRTMISSMTCSIGVSKIMSTMFCKYEKTANM